MKLSEISGSPYSAIVGHYFICRACGFMDRDMARMEVGHECAQCGVPGEGGRLVYPMSVLDLLDLMQAAMHAPPRFDLDGDAKDGAYSVVSVVLFFCTLREVLLTYLIESLCDALDVPPRVSERLLKDSSGYRERQDRLLPALTGMKWKDMIAQEVSRDCPAFADVDGLLETAAKARNKFMHEGRQDASLTRELAAQCIDVTPVLMDLYASLHNSHVRPLLKKRAVPVGVKATP